MLQRCVSVNLHTNNPCSHANRGLHHPTGCISPPLPSHTRTEREPCHTTHHHLPPPLASARERATSPITHSPPLSRMQMREGRVTGHPNPPRHPSATTHPNHIGQRQPPPRTRGSEPPPLRCHRPPPSASTNLLPANVRGPDAPPPLANSLAATTG